MDIQQENVHEVISQSQVSIEPVVTNITEEERKRAKLSEQMQSAQSFFGIVIRGLSKIIEEITSLILKR